MSAGGATTRRQRGQREAPSDVLRHRAPLEQRDPIVGGEAADRLGQPDARVDLAPFGEAAELPDELDHLRDARRGQRMTARLEPARRVHGQPAADGRVAIEDGPARLARRHEPRVLEREQLERRERVVQLRDIDSLGAESGHAIGGLRRDLGRPERREIRPVADGDGFHPLPDSRDAHRRPLGPQHHGGCPVRHRATVVEPQGIGDEPALHHRFERDGLLEVRERVPRGVCVVLDGHQGDLLEGEPAALHRRASDEPGQRRHRRAIAALVTHRWSAR